MNYLVFFVAFVFLQEVPLKPKEEFEIKLDYSFKPRPTTDHNTVNLDDPQKAFQKANTGVLPYLALEIKLLSLREEKMRMRISTNRGDRPVFKKVSVNSLIQLDLGFTDDMIDRVTSHEYTLTFFGADKTGVDRIVIAIGEDGSFVVNNEKRGKF